jgi:hypothetical protein
LLWFDPRIPGPTDVKRKHLNPLFLAAETDSKEGRYSEAAGLLVLCIADDPGNLLYVRSFLDAVQKNFAGKKVVLPTIQAKQAEYRGIVHDAVARGDWLKAIRNSMFLLLINAWDLSALTAISRAYMQIASEGEGAAYAKFRECAGLYLMCESAELRRKANALNEKLRPP